jgi:crotonobetainyl-CoA:carnitine CoA-transferase CaiB-like acyl-CoA transferase
MTPLTGLRVLDFSHVVAGPLATLYLAQLGAEVTKIEKPGGGDVMRASPSGAYQFAAFNAGKCCIELDLKSTEDRAEALRLSQQCDVLVDNFRPGALERAGLGYEAIKQVNSTVIYCSISGYGTHHAPWKHRGAYDHVIQAATGMAMMSGKEGDPPVKVGFPVVDVMTGVLAAFAVTAAVQERSRTGLGCHIDVSMWGAALQLMYPFTVSALATGKSPERVGNVGYSGSPAAEYFETLEGYIGLGANTSEQIKKLFPLLGLTAADAAHHLETGPGFARARDPKAFHDLVATPLMGRTAEEWEQLLNANGIPAARVRSIAEFTQEATACHALKPGVLSLGSIQTPTPGIGWTITH